jgi:glycosyltransferase involved in cell wall biosynthesis
MKGLKPDVIHSHHPLLMGDMATTFAERLDIPLVFTFHTLYEQYIQEYISIAPELSGKLAETIVRRYLEKCDHIIAPTRTIQELIQAYAVDVPVTIIPTPIDLLKYDELQPDRIRKQLNLNDEVVLLYLGRLSLEKNLGFLLSAFSKFQKDWANSRLVIVGGGLEGEHLKDLAEKLGIYPYVIFTGWVPYSEVPHYMAAADLFVFPSKTETQGLVLIEAMAAGTPVVAIDTPVNAEVVEDGGGLLVDEDENNFVSALSRILSNPSELEAMGKIAKTMASRYRIALAVEKLISVYESVILERS